MIRYLKKSASVMERLYITDLLWLFHKKEFSTEEIAGHANLTPQRASVILYELANQGHIARRFESRPHRRALFKHIPGHAFEVCQSKSKPRPKQKRKAKVGKPLLEQAGG